MHSLFSVNTTGSLKVWVKFILFLTFNEYDAEHSDHQLVFDECHGDGITSKPET